MEPFSHILNERRKRLGMPYKAVADRTGLSWGTVQRVFSGGKNVSLENFIAIANTLGLTFTLTGSVQQEKELIRKQAEVKANLLSDLVQGTSALEAQAVSSETVHQAKKELMYNLINGSKRRLWT